MQDMRNVTQLLRKIEDGDAQATEDLLPVVYDELRRLANAKMRREQSNHTLTSTALVHEAYLRLIDGKPVDEATSNEFSGTGDKEGRRKQSDDKQRKERRVGIPQAWANRAHFFSAAAEAMRRILIENARRKQRIKHGGQMKRHNVDDVEPMIERSADLLALDEALDLLLEHNELAGNLIKLRFYAGLTIPQAAWSLKISESQAKRLWTYGRAWLYERIYAE